jgi:hypothetical protein
MSGSRSRRLRGPSLPSTLHRMLRWPTYAFRSPVAANAQHRSELARPLCGALLLAASTTRVLLHGFSCESFPVISTLEPNSLGLCVLAYIGQSPTRFGFKTQLGYNVEHQRIVRLRQRRRQISGGSRSGFLRVPPRRTLDYTTRISGWSMVDKSPPVTSPATPPCSKMWDANATDTYHFSHGG